MNYLFPVETDDCLFDINEFKKAVEENYFQPNDGYSYPVKDMLIDKTTIFYIEDTIKLPTDATHVVWLNK